MKLMHIDALLDSEPSLDWVLNIVKCALSLACAHVPRYVAALDWALRDEPPPFCTRTYAAMYRRASSDDQWVAVSLITNAERDGRAARQLWSLAAAPNARDETGILKRHAVEKSRHVLCHLDLLDLTFPGAMNPNLRSELLALSPGYSTELALSVPQELGGSRALSVDKLLDINLTAIRTIARQSMQRSAVTDHCASDHLPHVTAIFDAILRDHLNQVVDTAGLVDTRVSDTEPGYGAALFSKCLRRLIRVTSEESIDFEYNLRFGNYP